MMLPLLLALVSVALLCTWTYPVFNRLLAGHAHTVRVAFTLGFSSTLGTLILVIVASVAFSPIATLATLFLLLACSLYSGKLHPKVQVNWRALSLVEWSIIGVVLGISLFILAHISYYPFIGIDTLNRYAYTAHLLVENGQLGRIVEDGYPLWLAMSFAVPLQYDLSFAEQIAKLIPYSLTVATLLATFGLAQKLFDKTVAFISVALLATSTLFVLWSGVAYLDIPVGLFFVLSCYAAWHWMSEKPLQWIVLAGLAVGLGVWVKQAGAAILLSLALVVLWQMVTASTRANAIRAAGQGLLIPLIATLLVGWWFVRNAFIFGAWTLAFPTPTAYYTAQVQQSWAQLLPFISDMGEFRALSAMLLLGGLLLALLSIRKPAVWLLLIFTLPYWYLWWQRFSYDPRFLLSILPFYAILASVGWAALIRRLPVRIVQSQPAQLAAIGLVLVMFGTAVYESKLGGIRQWIVAPTASYEARLLRVKGDLYEAVAYLDSVDPTASVYTTDNELLYYFRSRNVAAGYPADYADVQHYDYLIMADFVPGLYQELGQADAALFAQLDAQNLFGMPWHSKNSEILIYPILR